jgi:NADPH:quinone reductase-like Zn-dependent oxidoreductase
MRTLLKVLGVLVMLVAAAGAALAIALSHSSPCKSAPARQQGATAPMKAVVYRCYGPPEVLKLEEVEKPSVADGSLLVRVHAASVNPLDWHYMRGAPYFMRMGVGIGAPKDIRIGTDFAGTVEAVGKDVTRFKVGDEVFGGADGAFAQYVAVPEGGAIAVKPSAVTFEEAAATPIAGITALQALKDQGQLHAGEKVLINGASGGVGTFAVQIAKALGAEVTGVCSTRNVDRVRSLGADHVVDYTKEDFTQGSVRYDLILDTVGNHSFAEYQRVLGPQGRTVIIGGQPGNWIGPLGGMLKAVVLSPVMKQKFIPMMADLRQNDLATLAELMQAGKLKPVIDRHYRLDETPAAIGYLEAGHAQGKVVIDVD